MSESHTRGTLSWRPVTPEGTGGRSAMARASDGRPFKPYVYRGGDVGPPAAIAARERWRAREAEIERIRAQAAAEVMPDPAPGWEWYRELTDGELAELAGTRDRYQAAMAAVPGPRTPDPVPAPPPVAAPARCRRCKYLTTSAGHRVMCDD